MPAVAVAAWSAVAAVGIVVGGHVTAGDRRLHTDAAPFHGHWDLELGWQVLVPVLVGAVVIVVGPPLADRLPWRRLLLAASAAAFGWAAALAMTVGTHGFTRPMNERAGYLAGVALVDDPGHFLRTFTSVWPTFPSHVRSHPPGMVLVLWVLDRMGLSGTTWAALLVVTVGASAVAAVLLAVRAVADEKAARRIVPFLVLAPSAVWLATSADALFTGVAAWAVAVTVLATTRRRAWSVLAGVLWAAALLLSYGLVLLAPVAIGAAWWRRRLDVLLVTGGVAVLLLVTLGFGTGFWWPAGVAAARQAYWAGYAAERSGWVFLWLNLCALAIALGPAVAPALARLRRHGLVLLAAGALVGIAVADVSQLTRAEVERIWLPWMPWILVATAVLPLARRRWWLAGQFTTGVAVQLALRSTW